MAAGTPGAEGILITEYLLNALSDPDARAVDDNSYMDPNDEEAKLDTIDVFPLDAEPTNGGRTPLHIACSRDCDYEVCVKHGVMWYRPPLDTYMYARMEVNS